MKDNNDSIVLHPIPQDDSLYSEWDSGSKGGEMREDYRNYIWRKWIFIIVCIAASFIVVGITITVGEYPIGFFEAYQIIWDHITGNIAQTDIG